MQRFTIIPNDVIVDDSKNWLATIFRMSLAGDLMHYRMLGNMNTLIMKLEIWDIAPVSKGGTSQLIQQTLLMT